MSVEQRILDIAEGPNWYDGRELRAIALEVRKMEDRIKQLEEMYEGIPGERPDLLGTNVMGLLKRELNAAQQRIKRLEEALGLVVPDCSWVHHSKKHQHKCGEPCPVVALIKKAKEAKL